MQTIARGLLVVAGLICAICMVGPFQGVDLTQPATSFFGPSTSGAALTATQQNNRNLVITALVNASTGGATANPTKANLVSTELNTLMTTLVNNAANSTLAAQGACDAVLGSAIVALQ